VAAAAETTEKTTQFLRKYIIVTKIIACPLNITWFLCLDEKKN